MSAALRALLEGAIDYAGLFPPAGLSMAEAVENYDAYGRGSDAWALGRFVVPAARLREFGEVAAPRLPLGETAAPWRLSALLMGTDLETEVAQIADFDSRFGRSGGIVPDGERGGAWIDTVELRADAPASVERAAAAVPRWLDCFIEVPLGGDPEPIIRAIADAGLRAKARTGGVTVDAFPAAAQLARFIGCCVALRVPFKATAGLHHPLRAEYPLTYDAGAPRGTMFGYLNLFLASALAREGAAAEDVVALLDERDPGAITLDDEGATWREHRFPIAVLRSAHTDLALAFGSCSFAEPIGDARTMGML